MEFKLASIIWCLILFTAGSACANDENIEVVSRVARGIEFASEMCVELSSVENHPAMGTIEEYAFDLYSDLLTLAQGRDNSPKWQWIVGDAIADSKIILKTTKSKKLRNVVNEIIRIFPKIEKNKKVGSGYLKNEVTH